MSFIFQVKGGEDPCNSYKELTDADRERRFTQDTGKSDADDLQAGSWYRFTGEAGYKLSNRIKKEGVWISAGVWYQFPWFYDWY
ncbi:hypothetical protein ACROYT_G040263 [Oculina patagonica]